MAEKQQLETCRVHTNIARSIQWEANKFTGHSDMLSAGFVTIMLPKISALWGGGSRPCQLSGIPKNTTFQKL
jgi:hypothetical protein